MNHKYFNVKETTKVGKLEFNLDDPYSKESFDNAIKADDLVDKIDQFHNEVTRPYTKYGSLQGWDNEITAEQDKILSFFIEKCLDYMYDRKE